jgi:hypothetical protein
MDLKQIINWKNTADLSKELRLDVCTLIFDLKKFFNTHIAVAGNEQMSKRIRQLHIDRMVKAINLLDPSYIESLSAESNDLDLEQLKNYTNNSALKPSAIF